MDALQLCEDFLQQKAAMEEQGLILLVRGASPPLHHARARFSPASRPPLASDARAPPSGGCFPRVVQQRLTQHVLLVVRCLLCLGTSSPPLAAARFLPQRVAIQLNFCSTCPLVHRAHRGAAAAAARAARRRSTTRAVPARGREGVHVYVPARGRNLIRDSE